MRGAEKGRGGLLLTLSLTLALGGCTAPPVDSPVPTPEPTPEATLSPVYTDWSKLEPPAPRDREEVYVRYWDEPRYELIPSPDYGPLIAFRGTAITGNAMWGDEVWDYGWTDHLYGLMTSEGKVVVEPVYNNVTAIVVKDESGRYGTYPGARVCTQYAADSPSRYRYTLAAADGSWTTGPAYTYMSAIIGDNYEHYYGYSGYDGEALFAVRDGNLVLLDPYTGREKFVQPLPRELLQSDELYALEWALSDACLGEDLVTLTYHLENVSHALCWDLAGNSIPLPQEITAIRAYSEGLAAARTDGEGWGFIDRDGRWIIPPQYSYVTDFEKGHAMVRKGGYFFINPMGKALTEPVNTDHAEQTGEYWVFTGYSGDAGLVLDGALQPVDSPLLHRGYVRILNYGWATVATEEGPLLVKGTDSWTIPEGFDDYIFRTEVEENSVTLHRATEQGYETWRWAPATGELALTPDPTNIHVDLITGEPYQSIWDETYGGTTEIQDIHGKLLFNARAYQDLYGAGQVTLVGGNCLCQSYGDDGHTVLIAPDGTILMKKYWDDGVD